MNERFAFGTVEGTGAAINVVTGFTPAFVVAVNIDDAGTLAPLGMWISGMTAANMVKFLRIADNGSTGAMSHALATSNGISLYAGVAGSVSNGFTIGADADLNAAAETILWVAFAGD